MHVCMYCVNVYVCAGCIAFSCIFSSQGIPGASRCGVESVADSGSDMPVLDCLGANAIPTSLTMEPKYFKVGFKPRDRGMLERWIREGEERTRDLL